MTMGITITATFHLPEETFAVESFRRRTDISEWNEKKIGDYINFTHHRDVTFEEE